MTTPQEAGEAAGAGCGLLIFGFIVFVFLIAGCSAMFSGDTDDCYATPGALEGSAQHQRDIERCLGQ